MIIPTGHVTNYLVRPPEASLALYPLGKAAAPCPSDMLLRRDAVRAVGGFEEHFTGPRQMYEDQAFLAKLYLAYPVYFSDQVWLNYRQHDTSSVATVKRGGGYDDVRMYFLTWFERYMCEGTNPDPKVLKAIRSSIWLLRHPWASRLRSAIRRAPRELRRHASSLARGVSSISGRTSSR